MEFPIGCALLQVPHSDIILHVFSLYACW
uniref:Uncharacterized protein n=1 Tax=Arundo donax TaxID=35708 RepID=A0A0A9I276_ARUDO